MTAPSRASLVAAAAEQLRTVGIEDPARDARLLMRWASGLEAAALSARLDEMIPPDEAARFADAIAARTARVPVSHITGWREFWGRRFRVTRDVLDPRPETEALIAAALRQPPPARILDLGTGSGCILLTLLAEWPMSRGTGTDASPAALAIAAENARRLGVADRAELVETDWCAGLAGRFDLVVSNPPYIAAGELAGLASEVRLHEPLDALTPAGDPGDGLEAFRRIAAGIAPLLVPGARLMMEIGPTQGADVSAILAGAGLLGVSILEDLDRRDRVVVAKAP